MSQNLNSNRVNIKNAARVISVASLLLYSSSCVENASASSYVSSSRIANPIADTTIVEGSGEQNSAFYSYPSGNASVGASIETAINEDESEILIPYSRRTFISFPNFKEEDTAITPHATLEFYAGSGAYLSQLQTDGKANCTRTAPLIIEAWAYHAPLDLSQLTWQDPPSFPKWMTPDRAQWNHDTVYDTSFEYSYAGNVQINNPCSRATTALSSYTVDVSAVFSPENKPVYGFMLKADLSGELASYAELSSPEFLRQNQASVIIGTNENGKPAQLIVKY